MESKVEINPSEIELYYDVQLKRAYRNEGCTSEHPVIVLVYPDQPKADLPAEDSEI